MQTPPQLPKPQKEWWGRNWKWFVPVLVLGLIPVTGGFVMLLFGVMRSSDAYAGAFTRAKASPTVMAELGTPIEEGFFVTGNIALSGASGNADLAIPIHGPKGRATIYVNASRSLGEWHFDRLVVQIAESGKRIDLSERPKGLK